MEFGLQPERVWISVYEHDSETLAIWRDEIGVPMERIQRLGDKDNFWAAGPTGPCGPCSELYYDFHPERGSENATVEDDSRFIEFYNLVRGKCVRSTGLAAYTHTGVHGEQPLAGWHTDAAGEQEHRHGNGPGAHGANPAARAQQLRDGPHLSNRAARC